ncbi:Hypothetical predicted protein [Cloeon dipterum]|uniref:SEFIR domain-containing protein n=1 Tax=Cloeon dipterum TaxID=197152 RepID=A0A8S1CBB8_9INSE|nr:Hypothetical predicted protein [Cloeon dipterum]
MMGMPFAALLTIISILSFFTNLVIADYLNCPRSFDQHRIKRSIACSSSTKLPKRVNASLTSWGKEHINVSLVWPLINCDDFKNYNAMVTIYRKNEPDDLAFRDEDRYFTKYYTLRTDQSSPASSGTLEQFQIKAKRGYYGLKLVLSPRIRNFNGWSSSTLYVDGATNNANLSFKHDKKETLTFGLDQKVPAIFNGRIEPKLDPYAKVYISMTNKSAHTNQCVCDENTIDWDAFDEASLEEQLVGFRSNSVKGICTMESKDNSTFIDCDFVRVPVEGDGVYFKVIVRGDSLYKVKTSSTEKINDPPKTDSDPHQPGVAMRTMAILLVVVCTLASIAILFILIKNRTYIWKTLMRKYDMEPQVFSKPLMSTTSGSKMSLNILLVYSKTTENFKNAVGELNKNLCKVFPSSEVIDIFHEDYEQQLNIHGLEFITKFTREGGANPNVKIILIHSDETVGLLQKRGHLKEWEENEKLIKIVYKDLTENPCQLKYNKVYNVCLEKFPLTDPNQRIKLNNLTTYYYPRHSELLCRDLCKTAEV